MNPSRATVVTLVALLALIACHRRRHPVVEDAPTPLPAVQSPPADAGTATLCGGPCCGGYACAVTQTNAGHGGCNPGASTCNACPSGLTCVPGACGSMLIAGEAWALRASYIAGGDVPDMCASPRRNAWACLRQSAFAQAPASEWTCLPMSEPCASGSGHGVTAASVSTEDLTVRGIDIEIRDGGPSGAVLAVRVGARYLTGLQRAALCSGLKFDKLTDVSGSGISVFSYFLDPAR